MAFQWIGFAIAIKKQEHWPARKLNISFANVPYVFLFFNIMLKINKIAIVLFGNFTFLKKWLKTLTNGSIVRKALYKKKLIIIRLGFC
jgi:hypothetical protein